jgi:hypothetical protein
MPLPGDESSAICPTVSVELATLGSITEEHANEAALTSHESSISLAHTYVHGGDLFTIVEADEPLESSVVESEMPRFVPGLATLSSLTYVASSTLLSLPSPFSRGNLCIKDIDALMSSESETESCVFVPFSALRSHQPTFQIFDDAFLLCLGRRRIRPLPWPSRHPRESAFCSSVPLARQPGDDPRRGRGDSRALVVVSQRYVRKAQAGRWPGRRGRPSQVACCWGG